MEQIILKSANAEARINLDGAELCSYKNEGQEYIWEGNPRIWGRHAPVLFPFVGKLRNDSYTYAGKVYTMGQHGFARDKRFSLVRQTQTSVVLSLKSDADTEGVYPFAFELLVGYSLNPEGVVVKYDVLNLSQEKEMYFSIGAHPGFRCPLFPGEEMLEDYTLDFQNPTLRELPMYPLEGGHIVAGQKMLPLTKGKLRLTDDLFAHDALILDVQPEAAVRIVNERTRRGFGMSFSDFRWLGLWSKQSGAGFVCIEPWNGIADTLDHDGVLENKLGIQRLAAGRAYTVSHTLFFW